jgi:hypothetical protein
VTRDSEAIRRIADGQWRRARLHDLKDPVVADNLATLRPSTQVGYGEPSEIPEKSSLLGSVDHRLDQGRTELKTLIAVWPFLPSSTRKVILALCGAAS